MSVRGILAPLLIALAVLAVLFAVVTWLPLRQARASWMAGRNADAIAEASRSSRLTVWRAQNHQLLAAAWLSAGNEAADGYHALVAEFAAAKIARDFLAAIRPRL